MAAQEEAKNVDTPSPDDISTITHGITKSIAIVALILIIWIDANSQTIDTKDVELILAGYIAGAEIFQTYKKVRDK